MSKVAQAVLDEFGRSVKRARTLNGWGHKDLAAQINPAPGRSFLCDIEKGKRDIGPVTVGKLIKALGLDSNWIDRFLDADVSPDAEETKLDRDAERLMRLAAQDETAPETAEDLLISLAQEYALGRYDTPAAAYNDLRATLQVAADLKARGMLPQNTSDQVTTLMRRMAELNDQGLRDEAATEVDTALADLDASHAAQKSALIDLGIRQDRIRNNPESAAKRLLAQLRSVAHPGGLFNAIHATWEEWFDRGDEKGVAFDLNVALHLARSNLDRSKGVQRLQALVDLGITQGRLGEREGRNDRLMQSIITWRAFLAETPRKRDPKNWALGMNNLATVLQTLGERETGTARLLEAVDAFDKVLILHRRDRVPLDWALTQNNLGNALRILGDREPGTARLREAVTACRAALEEWARDRVPLNWAGTQNNLGNALRALGEREPGTARLDEAVTAHRAALEEWTRDRVPLDWAMAQNSLGIALCALGQSEPSTARLEEAVTVYRAALEEYTRDRVPLDWAMTQNNLGTALQSLGRRKSSTARLEESVIAHLAALEEFTRDRVPLDWAASWGNMGEAMSLLADCTDDLTMARQALRQLQEAEAVLRDGGHATFASYSADRIPRAEAVIARLS